jgi:glycosyltransferase involved in cell wall biosynthesis
VIEQRQHHAMIFTSRWEGLPNVLIEFGTLGLPIVAAKVGGIGELVTDETGYPVPERPAAEDYVRALRAIRADPAKAAMQSARLIGRIADRHSRGEFERSVGAIPGYFG